MSSPASAAPDAPAISVVMAVYNGADVVAGAIDSILSQNFTDFEFIIVDDGSEDETPAILKSYAQKDPRIVVVTQVNQGLTRSLNNGAAMARGRYIARQDADDVSYPHRFAAQMEWMARDPELVLIGGCSDDVHDDGMKSRWTYHDDRQIQDVVFVKTPFPHSTALFRADAFRAAGGYDVSFKTAQDMDLWMRLAAHGRLAMVKDPILLRRVSGGSISAKRRWRQFYDALRARLKHGPNPALAVYHSLRSVAIALLPSRFIQNFREQNS